MRKYWWLLFIPLLGCQGTVLREEEVFLRGPEGQEARVQIEIADEQHERMQGLMFREELEEGTGMLFVFEDEQIRSFWMKNTLISLDILFFDTEGEFVSSSTMTPCTDDPCKHYMSDKPALYALEVPAGFVKRYDVGAGWVLR